MRTFPINGNAAEVEEALLMTAAAVEPAGAGRWKVAPRQGQGMTVIASIEHGWLCFDASLNGRSPSMDAGAAEWALLESNPTRDNQARAGECSRAGLGRDMAAEAITIVIALNIKVIPPPRIT